MFVSTSGQYSWTQPTVVLASRDVVEIRSDARCGVAVYLAGVVIGSIG